MKKDYMIVIVKKCGYSIHPWRYEQCDRMCEDYFYDEREKEDKDN